MKHAVYRHYDIDGNLLYVGISLNVAARLCGHKTFAKWFYKIVRIEIEWFDDREIAKAEERKLIETIKPIYNVKFNATEQPVDTDRDVLRTKEVAFRLGLNYSLFYSRWKSGKIPLSPIENLSILRWRASDVDAFLSGNVSVDGGN